MARDALLAAVPFAAVAALLSFGEYLEAREDAVIGLQALLWGAATTLLVVSCAARSPEAATHTLPPLGRSALVGCLAVFALKATVAAVQHGRRLVLRPGEAVTQPGEAVCNPKRQRRTARGSVAEPWLR